MKKLILLVFAGCSIPPANVTNIYEDDSGNAKDSETQADGGIIIPHLDANFAQDTNSHVDSNLEDTNVSNVDSSNETSSTCQTANQGKFYGSAMQANDCGRNETWVYVNLDSPSQGLITTGAPDSNCVHSNVQGAGPYWYDCPNVPCVVYAIDSTNCNASSNGLFYLWACPNGAPPNANAGRCVGTTGLTVAAFCCQYGY